jgi:hypothetical protein
MAQVAELYPTANAATAANFLSNGGTTDIRSATSATNQHPKCFGLLLITFLQLLQRS